MEELKEQLSGTFKFTGGEGNFYFLFSHPLFYFMRTLQYEEQDT
jgi:hypothetical protein